MFAPLPVVPAGERFRVVQSDAVEWLRTLPPESVDLVVTDPAYESLEKHRAHGSTTRLVADWFPTVPNAYFEQLFAEFHRVLVPNSHCYVLCDQETMFAIKPMGEAAGFKFWKPLVWEKQKMGMGYHYRATYEFVLFFEKGKRRLNSLSVKDVLSFPRVGGGQFSENWREKRAEKGTAYPTEKPVGLLEVLVQQSSQPGELVIDPFVGSGSTGEAALRNERRFAGSDLTERGALLARARCENASTKETA